MGDKGTRTIVIVGGGIVGTAIARELSRHELKVMLLEKNPDLAMGATKANSGILHAGFDAAPGSLKAKLNVRGNQLYRNIAEDLKLDLDLVGSLVVAKNEEELQALDGLLTRGRQNGVRGLSILSRDKLLDREPNLASDVAGALYAELSGVLLPFGAALAFAENAVRNGAAVLRECPVEKIVISAGRVAGVETPNGFIAADFVINAAGLHADEVSRTAGDDSFHIHPRRGEYILFDKAVGTLVRSVIFPTPTKISKGILVSPTIHGNLFIGPNAEDLSDKDDHATSKTGLEELIQSARRLVPGIPTQAAITQFAGLRAVADSGDFVIRPSQQAKGLIQAAGIQSPGLTAAPAIAEMVVEILRDEGMELTPKVNFVPVNPPKTVFHKLDDLGKEELYTRNNLYGRVICRCETVTEAEIVDAIHSCCGATTLDGVKRRTRSGMGRCQGGFCGPRVTAILARELGISIAEVRKDTARSCLFYEKYKGDGME